MINAHLLRRWRGLALLCLLPAIFFGCARPAPAPTVPAEQVWRVFAEKSLSAPVPAAYMIRASINYASPERNSRVLARLWSGTDAPVRLEISSSMGQVYSNIREDAKARVSYSPLERTAKVEPAVPGGMPPMGHGVPFTLRQMAALFTGRWLDVLPGEYATATPDSGGWRFTLPAGSPAAWIVLNTSGQPVSLGGPGAKSWTMRVEEWPDAADKTMARPDLPRLFKVTNPPSTEAVFRIKDVEERTEPWEKAALTLNLPPETDVTIVQPGQ